MDVSKILAELRAERALLDEVIANLERVAVPTTVKRGRGRPRKYPAPVKNFPAGSEEPSSSNPSEDAQAARMA
jgi:hypothetical protein